MPNKGAVPNVLLVVIILVSLSLAGGTYYLFYKERLKALSLKEELEDVRAKEKIIESKLEDSQKEVVQLETQFRQSKSQIDFLSSEINAGKKTNQDLLTQLEQSKVDLEKERKGREEVEAKLTQSQQTLKTLQAEFKDLEDKKAELEVKVKGLDDKQSQNVELGTIIVGQQEPAAVKTGTNASNSLEGKILVINKDYNFAVINLGSKDGVNVEDIFSAYRKDKYIGDLRIEKVHESMSAANFLSPDVKDKVREGDKVVIKHK